MGSHYDHKSLPEAVRSVKGHICFTKPLGGTLKVFDRIFHFLDFNDNLL